MRITARMTEILLLSAAALALVPASASADEIEKVVVTAQRYQQDVQDVPLSVSALSGDKVEQIFESGQDIKAIANHIPGVYAESSNGRLAPRFYIRGLGNTDFDLSASQPVSIIYDDVVMENAILKSSPIYDIDDVEVSRGPQGTLFGRNTTAGVIKFTSKKPTDTFEGDATASYGSLGTTNVEAAVGGPLMDKVSFRISGLWQHRDNYIDNAYTGEDNALGGYNERAGRIQLLIKPDENLSILLNVHGRSLDGTAAMFRANILDAGSNKLNSNYVWDKVWYNSTANNPQRYDGVGTNANVTYDFGPVTLTSITGYEETHGYSHGDVDGGNATGPGTIPFQSESQDGLTYLHQFTQEMHLASNDAGRLFWQVGGLYYSTDYENATHTFPGVTYVDYSNVSWALFGQAHYMVTDALTITGGLRWTSDVKGMTAHGDGGTVKDPVKTMGNNVSWDLTIDYAFNEDVKAYARAATGFRAPSIQGRNIAFGSGYSTARSETITSYEMGLKSELFDHSLRFNVDAFSYYVHNMQFTAIGGASNSAVLMNARGGVAYGMEADAEYRPIDNLSFTLGGSYTKTMIRDSALKTAVCALCTVTDKTDSSGNAYLNNNPFPQAPEFMLTFTANYDYPLADGSALFASTDWWLQGATNFFLYQSKEFHTNGNYEGGLRAGYRLSDKKTEIALYVRNITDKANLQGAIDFDNLTGFVGDPRIIGVELKTKL